MRKTPKKYIAFRGKNKKRWIAVEDQIRKMRKDERLIKIADKEMELLTRDAPPLHKILGKLVAKTANSVMRFNPTAIVAVESRGLPAARLVQYYIEKKTGKKIRVYPVKLEGERGPGRTFGPDAKLVPARAGILPELKKQSKIALIDETAYTGSTAEKMTDLLGKFVGKKKKLDFFPLAHDVPLWDKSSLVSPYQSKIRNPGERALEFSRFKILRKLVDEQLEKEKQEKK